MCHTQCVLCYIAIISGGKRNLVMCLTGRRYKKKSKCTEIGGGGGDGYDTSIFAREQDVLNRTWLFIACLAVEEY